MKPNLFYLLEEDGRSLAVQNGIVTNFSNPTPLPHAPEGWLKILISFERLMNRYGMQRSFTTPLDFPLEGAFIIRDLVYRQNYERKIFFLIQQLTPDVDASFYRLVYRYLYKGELDLSTFNDKESFITCNIMEGGIKKLLKANENTVYEIPFDSDAVNVKMDGVIIRAIMSLLSIEQTQFAAGLSGQLYNTNWLNLQFINSEGLVKNGAGFSTGTGLQHNSATSHDDNFFPDNYFFEATDDITIKLSFPITVTLANAISTELYIKNSNGTRTQLLMMLSDDPFTTVPFQKIQTYNISADIPVAAGEKLFLISELRDSPIIAGSAGVEYSEFNMEVLFDSRYRETIIKGFKPYDLFKKLVLLITGATDNAVSTLLQLSSESDKLITCGDAIRGITGAKIKISLSQFYEHVNVLHFAGEGVKNSKIEIETRSYFFDPSDPIDLGEVKDLEVNEAVDMMGNTFKIGWPDPNVEDVNGKYAFNGSHVYSSLITRISKEIQFLSQISADPYEIEMIRINLEGKTTTDDSTDNKNYVIHADLTAPEEVEGIGTVYPLYRRVYDSIEGVPNDTVFNVELSPKRLLIKHGPWLRSLLYPFDSQKLTFRSTERNANLKTVIGSEVIQENADQNIFSLGDRLFLPFYAEFGTEIPTDLVSIMETNPNRCFSFNAYGYTFKGFNIKISIEVNTEQEQKVKLLLAPDTNLLNFIR